MSDNIQASIYAQYDEIAHKVGFEDIKNGEDFIKYIQNVYGGDFFLKPYRPILVYIFGIIQIFLFLTLFIIPFGPYFTQIYDSQKFHQLWIFHANINYVSLIIFFLVLIYTRVRQSSRDFLYFFPSIFYFFTFPVSAIILWMRQLINKKSSLLNQDWLFVSILFYIFLLLIPLTWWIGRFLGNIIF